MNHVNCVVIEGVLAKDPDETPLNVILEVRCNRTYGKVREKIVHTVVVEGRIAEACMRFLSRGSHVLVSGTLADRGVIHGREVKFLPKVEPKKVKAEKQIVM